MYIKQTMENPLGLPTYEQQIEWEAQQKLEQMRDEEARRALKDGKATADQVLRLLGLVSKASDAGNRLRTASDYAATLGDARVLVKASDLDAVLREVIAYRRLLARDGQ